VHGSVLQCVAVCCSVLQCVAVHLLSMHISLYACSWVWCSALQCIAVHCSTFALTMMCTLLYYRSQNHEHNFVLGFKIARTFKNKTIYNSVLLIFSKKSVTHSYKDLMELWVHGEHGCEDILVRRNQLSKILFEKSEQPSQRRYISDTSRTLSSKHHEIHV